MRISISISFPFGGVIVGVSGVFRDLPLRRETQRETPENLDSTAGGPNGIRTRVSALRGPCPRPLDDGATSVRRGNWLGEEDLNLHYGVQSPASYH